ncbi:MAG: PAS domain S-box protein, partial [Desulfomonile sp.]|nr:PAS domain S-box protein [Desulfomonile sp.]
MKIEHKIVRLSLVGVILIWIADAALDYLFFSPHSSFLSLLITDVPPHNLCTRVVGAALVIMIGLIAGRHVRDLREDRDTLKQEIERVSVTLSSIGDAVIAADEQDRITAMNAMAEQLTGRRQAEALGLPLQNVLQIIDPTTRVRCESPISKVHRTGRASEFKNGTILVAKDGTERIIADSVAPIRDLRGRIIGVVVVFRDVTAEKHAEQALIASEAKSRLLYEQAPLGYQSLDQDGRILEVNQVWLRTLGFSREEVIGRWFGDILTTQSKETFKEKFELFKAAGEIHGREFDMVKKDGTIISALFDGTVARDAEGRFLRTHCVLQDITEKKLAEEALRQNEQVLAQIINFLPDATFVIDKEGTVIAWNRAVEELTGVKACDMLGKGNYEYSLAFYPGRRPVLIDAALHPDKEFDQPYLYVKRDRDVFVSESDSSTLKIPGVHLWNRARPLYDSQGNIVGAVESIRDITDQKKAQETALQAERLKAIVDLAGGVAHNFNNLLQIIIGGLDLTLLELQQNNIEEARKNLRQMVESCQFGAETVRRLQ